MMKIMLIIVMASVAFRQDDTPPKEEQLVPPVDELKIMRREKIKSFLANVLLERYIRPFDEWSKSGGYTKARIQQTENSAESDFGSENWFALVVRSTPHDPIWVKFCLTRIYQKHELNVAQSNETINQHITETRAGLKTALEQTFILLLDDEDVRESMIFGDAHIYQLITRDSDIMKLRKEDMLY